MKLEHQVTNLEISKRLKELGVGQNAFWSWYETMDRDDTPRLNRTDENCLVCNLPKQPWEDKHSAFTCAELGEMLPEPTDKKHYVVMKDGNQWCLWETEDGFYDKDGNHVYADTEANARGKMLIYLIENGLCLSPSKT